MDTPKPLDIYFQGVEEALKLYVSENEQAAFIQGFAAWLQNGGDRDTCTLTSDRHFYVIRWSSIAAYRVVAPDKSIPVLPLPGTKTTRML